MIRKVACISRRNLKEIYQQHKLVLRTNFETAVNDFDKIEFIDKTLVETDETYKQIIPYTIVRNQTNQIALYRRKGNEKRLHGLWSAGFGGHIEDFEYDESEPVDGLFFKSAIRELNEEFSDKTGYNLQFEGIINEEETKVGRTHIGLVFSVSVDKNLFTTSHEIENLAWININKVADYRKELWSEMAIELITR